VAQTAQTSGSAKRLKASALCYNSRTWRASASSQRAAAETWPMDVERTIHFLLKNQARMDARMDAKFAKADARFIKAEKRLDRLEQVVAQNNRIVSQLVRYGVSLRSDVRRIDRALADLAEKQAETDEKLNALIDIVDQSMRRNGR
jgi:hypothetical protein